MKNNFDISAFVPIITEEAVTQGLVERFRKRRKEIGVTQRQLALRSGVSFGSVRRFETEGEISLRSLLRIASAIGRLEDFEALFSRPNIRSLKDVK